MASHPGEDLIHYADGTLDDGERAAVERHLETCEDCRKHVSFLQEFKSGLRQLSQEEFTSDEPCPESWTLASYEANDLDEETDRHLRVHLLFCDRCTEEFYALRRVHAAEDREKAGQAWTLLLDKLREYAIDFAQNYGPGTLLGPIRIVGEHPAFAVRGEEGAARLSKVLEFSLSENSYSIEVALSEDGSVSFDIAGLETPRRDLLRMTVRSADGRELFATQTDDKGNSSLALDPTLVPSDAFVLSLRLGSEVSHLLFHLPS